jgi:hypothetical protein
MIKPKHVRYIKLGKGGSWEEISLSRNELHFGHSEIPHEIALSQDIDLIRAEARKRRTSAGAASHDAREVLDFYQCGSDCLWLTFSQGRLWWAFAEPEVTWLGPSAEDRGSRTRKVIGRWSDEDLRGEKLVLSSLSSKLTKTSSFRRTICELDKAVADYAVRRINGIVEPIVEEAAEAVAKLVAVTQRGIEVLHWKDFETLADLIFARSGWNRTSPLGGTQKDIDLQLEQPSTGETASVQVKASANQAIFDDCVRRFKASGTTDRLFFITHTPARIVYPENSQIKLWTGEELAKTVTHMGLHDWVFEKIR